MLGREDDGQSAIARQLAFWTDALKGLPDQIDLPSDRPRPAVASHRGDSVRLTLDPELHRGLLGLAREIRAGVERHSGIVLRPEAHLVGVEL